MHYARSSRNNIYSVLYVWSEWKLIVNCHVIGTFAWPVRIRFNSLVESVQTETVQSAHFQMMILIRSYISYISPVIKCEFPVTFINCAVVSRKQQTNKCQYCGLPGRTFRILNRVSNNSDIDIYNYDNWWHISMCPPFVRTKWILTFSRSEGASRVLVKLTCRDEDIVEVDARPNWIFCRTYGSRRCLLFIVHY